MLSLLGEGAMGDVYLCRHREHGRLEAVKVLKFTASSFSSRFRREARAMNRLRHPNIVKVYDFGQLPDGRLFLAMEHAEGTNLERLMEPGPLSLTRAVKILIQLADAVDHAHGRAVIHRDLKPANLIIGHDDRVRVLDFGVAKILSPQDRDGAVTGNKVLGTPAYMAPEQVRGIGDEPRIDIYSLGCIAYHLVVGAPPFTGRPIDVCQAHVSQAPLKPSVAAQRPVPEELEDLILRCLRKKPRTRPHSAATVANILRGVLASLPNETADSNIDTVRQLELQDSTIRDANLQIDAGVTTTRVQPAPQLVEAWQHALRTLAEALVDHGCVDAELLLALTAVGTSEGELDRIQSEIARVGDELARHDARTHDRILSLRFSLGELQFAAHNGTHGEGEQLAMNQVISDIQTQLATLENERNRRRRQLEERELSLAAELADAHTRTDETYLQLAKRVEALLPDFSRREEITKLVTEVEELRPFPGQLASRQALS